jgi:hypothetical protein
MPLPMRYALLMTGTDAVLMVLEAVEGPHGPRGQLVIAAAIVLFGVGMALLEARDAGARRGWFVVGLTVTLAYAALDTVATAAFLLLWRPAAGWTAVRFALALNGLVILVLGTLASAVLAAVLVWRGPPPAPAKAARPRLGLGLALFLVVVVLSRMIREFESARTDPAFLTALAVVSLVFGAVILGLVWWARRRGAAYRRYCRARGFDYAAWTRVSDADHQALVEAIGRGVRQSWLYRIDGRWNGEPFRALESRPSNEPTLGVVLWHLSGRVLPTFTLTPGGFWQQVGAKLGLQDIDFDADPSFSQAYWLRGRDEPAIRALFTPAVRRFLAAHPGQRVAASGPYLAWWVEGGLPNADALDAFLERGDAVHRAFSA